MPTNRKRKSNDKKKWDIFLWKTLLREFNNSESEKILMKDGLMFYVIFYDLQYHKTEAQYFYKKYKKYW